MGIFSVAMNSLRRINVFEQLIEAILRIALILCV